MVSLYKTHGRMWTSVSTSIRWGTSYSLGNGQHGGMVNTDMARLMSRNSVSSLRTASLESANAVQTDDQKVKELGALNRVLEMKNENEQLKMAKMCKVCFSAEIQILILPCRHLVCCEECKGSLHECVVCGRVVQAAIKTYFA